MRVFISRCEWRFRYLFGPFVSKSVRSRCQTFLFSFLMGSARLPSVARHSDSLLWSYSLDACHSRVILRIDFIRYSYCAQWPHLILLFSLGSLTPNSQRLSRRLGWHRNGVIPPQQACQPGTEQALSRYLCYVVFKGVTG